MPFLAQAFAQGKVETRRTVGREQAAVFLTAAVIFIDTSVAALPFLTHALRGLRSLTLP